MGGGHGIGIKRNDYRRRNRRENISMHSKKHGYQKPSANNALLPYVEVSVEQMSQNELVKRAQKHWRTWRDEGKTIEEACFRYVRHMLTNYDLLWLCP